MDLFAVLYATWPPGETCRVGPWTLRRGDGGGSRVSAATLDGPIAGPEAAEAAMRQWGQRPLFMIRNRDAALDAILDERGYSVLSPSLLLEGDATQIAHSVPDVTTIDCEAPLAAMKDLWLEDGVGPSRLAVMDRAPDPKTYFMGRMLDRPAGVAFVASSARVAMLHALYIRPSFRGKGLGTRLTRAAAEWALSQGATTLALAVEEANAPARRLYSGLGMREAGRYHYRAAPEEPAP